MLFVFADVCSRVPVIWAGRWLNISQVGKMRFPHRKLRNRLHCLQTQTSLYLICVFFYWKAGFTQVKGVLKKEGSGKFKKVLKK